MSFTGFGQMNFVSLPLGTAFLAIVSLLVIGRANIARGWGNILRRTPANNIIHALVILHPHLAQDFYRRKLPEPPRSRSIKEGVKQLSSLLPNLFSQYLSLG